ncbi:5'-nucleotidase C-terminal domain-containing protein [bacterium]|nr:5'-nucleotidase C-terminal domain-containing protein [bacterium]
MERLVNAVNQFDRFTPSGSDKMKFASGDIMLGEDPKHVKVADEFLNISGFLATVLGNHECDMPTPQFVDLIKDKKYKLLGMNLNPSDSNPIHNIIEKSYIQEINGHKYGIIGLVPPDLHIHVKLQEHLPDLHIEEDFEKSIPELQKEVDKFAAQGINKIIVLSHAGYRQDVKIAKSVKGIDVILGAHTHTLLEGVEENKNLFYSSTGEPIVITQAGRDGKQFGVLNLEFNKDGVITKVQNNMGKTDVYGRNLVARNMFENILGKPEKVGELKYVEKYPADAMGQENPHCDFIVDALRSELGTDIAVMNSANIRGQFEAGRIDTRDLAIISPFANKVVVINATEEEIFNAIANRAKASMKSNSHRPGLVQVSGLRYTFNNNGDILSMTFIDKEGKETPIDVKNPRKDKMYTVASDDFCVGNTDGGGLSLPHRLETALKKFDYDKDIVVGEYIKHQTKPIEIRSDGRITKVEG